MLGVDYGLIVMEKLHAANVFWEAQFFPCLIQHLGTQADLRLLASGTSIHYWILHPWQRMFYILFYFKAWEMEHLM